MFFLRAVRATESLFSFTTHADATQTKGGRSQHILSSQARSACRSAVFRAQRSAIRSNSMSSTSSFQSPLKHPNERCTSCGLWKRKLASCKHCARSPNRHQVAAKSAQIIPQPLAKARSASVTMHPNERCRQCGLWKTKFQECTHCAGRANRMQATVAQMLQAGMLPDAKPFETSPLLLHEKERCHSCGLWSAFFGTELLPRCSASWLCVSCSLHKSSSHNPCLSSCVCLCRAQNCGLRLLPGPAQSHASSCGRAQAALIESWLASPDARTWR